MKITLGIALFTFSLGLAPAALAEDAPPPPQEPVGSSPAPKKPKSKPRPPVGKRPPPPGTTVEEPVGTTTEADPPKPKPNDKVGTVARPEPAPHKVGKVMQREPEEDVGKRVPEPEGKRGPPGGEGTRTVGTTTKRNGKKPPPPEYGDPPKE